MRENRREPPHSAPAPADPGAPRREALRAAGRWLAAGALALAGGWLVARRRTGAECERACRGCPLLRQCTLPDAQAARRSGTGG